MLVWILVLYLHDLVANPRTIAGLKLLLALFAARWGPPASEREADISPAAARGRSARNP